MKLTIAEIFRIFAIIFAITIVLGAACYGCKKTEEERTKQINKYIENDYEQVVVKTGEYAPRTIWVKNPKETLVKEK